METKRGLGGPARVLGLALIALASAPAAAASSDDRPAYVERGQRPTTAPACRAGGWRRQRLYRHRLTAAHRELSLGQPGDRDQPRERQAVEVETSDRGPYAEGRVIDLSEAPAARIGLTREDGTAPVPVVASAR